MQEKNLLRVAILCSIIGIFVLIIISNSIELKKLTIGEITNKHIGQAIKTEGKIFSIITAEDFTILEIKDKTGKIKIMVFENITLKQNQEILIEGKVKEYKDEFEIEADKIKIL